MPKEVLEQLINNKDTALKRGTDNRISQSVILTINDSRTTPTLLREVIRLIDYGTWQSVQVIEVSYDQASKINGITLKPIGEQLDEEDVEEIEEDY